MRNKLISIVFFLIILMFFSVGKIYVNMIEPKGPFEFLLFAPLFFVGAIIWLIPALIALPFNVLIEFSVAFPFLKRLLKNKTFSRNPLLGQFFLINLITWPATQIIFRYLTKNYDYWFSVLIVELIVILTEFYLLKWRFNFLKKRNYLVGPVPTKLIWITDITMNLVSYIFGLIIFFPMAEKFALL